MREKGYNIPGISEGEIKKIQQKAREDVAKRREGVEEILTEKKRQHEFREASEHKGMDKADLTRSSRAKL